MATKIVCKCAGAVIKKANPSIWAGAAMPKPPVTPKKLTRTDRPTDTPTDGHSGL